ncbi:hypothetical protein QAD02_008150 [Eretmocerus hayati]|uniref:Uncharacterized protein n=1 Tax=Eretmocerus hayati TaxID=131215 RepID=A0ACC2N5Q2_9HYME|nr:hypothetical protein QAD02_008150 [Eretmocerus hayati]
MAEVHEAAEKAGSFTVSLNMSHAEVHYTTPQRPLIPEMDRNKQKHVTFMDRNDPRIYDRNHIPHDYEKNDIIAPAPMRFDSQGRILAHPNLSYLSNPIELRAQKAD